MDLGSPCPVCGKHNSADASACLSCGNALSSRPSGPTTERVPAPRPTVPGGGGASGGPRPVSSGPAKTMFFGALQQQDVTPRLVVIKGEGADGVTYQLSGESQTLGRAQCDLCFAEDPFLSPQHAKFVVQGGRLFVQDLDSTNGIFVRIKAPVVLENGSLILVGEQLLQLDSRPIGEYVPDDNGTYFYGSPRPDSQFRVIQCLAGGGLGLAVSAGGGLLTIGREGNVLNFPDDKFISGQHAQLQASPGGNEITLTDLRSRNGTYIRISGAQELFHADYLFVGQQLFRVEIA